MKEKEFPVLEVTDVEWDKDHSEFEKLPKNFQLKWDKKNWTSDEVSNWVSKKFDWVFDSLILIKLGFGKIVDVVVVLGAVAAAS